MPRRPLDYLTALSTLLLGAWFLLALLSCAVPAGGDVRRGGRWHGFALRDGELLVWAHVPATEKNKNSFPHSFLKPEWDRADISLRAGPRPPASVGWELTLPFWLITSLVGLLPACRLVAWRRKVARARARADGGLCPACGYDLQGCISPVCPECGAAKWRGGKPLWFRTGAGPGRT